MPKLPTAVNDIPGGGSGGLSTNEKLVDLLMERAIDLLRVEVGTRAKVIALLDQLERDLIAEIARLNIAGTPGQQSEKARLRRLLDWVTSSIQSTYRGVNVLMAAEVRELIDVESVWIGHATNTAIGIDFIDAGVTRGVLQTLVSDVIIQGAATKEWWSRQAGGLAEKFSDEIRRGVLLGESNSKLIDRVRGTTAQRGVMEIARSSAERLVRASVQTAANVARENMYDDNADLIASLQWHATLDTRTSEWCLVRDGHQYTPKDHQPIGHDIPWREGPGKLHWGCRSTSVPVLKTWRELGIDEDEVPDTTRASMDGQVPAATTFESWLKKQSVERQNTVLGATKAQLWRDGRIELRDLLDQEGRPLTVEQLKAKSGRPTT